MIQPRDKVKYDGKEWSVYVITNDRATIERVNGRGTLVSKRGVPLNELIKIERE